MRRGKTYGQLRVQPSGCSYPNEQAKAESKQNFQRTLLLYFSDSNSAAERGNRDRRVTRPEDRIHATQYIRNPNALPFDSDRCNNWPSSRYRLSFRGRRLGRTFRCFGFNSRHWRRSFAQISKLKVGNYIVLLGNLCIQLKRRVMRKSKDEVPGHVGKSVIA